MINGWYDIYARDNFLIYDNLTVPKRLLVRPNGPFWHRGSRLRILTIAAEAHRWFDYWLKGINNGIMDEPPIHYYLQGADKAQDWQSTDVWPLKDQATSALLLRAGDSAGKVSVNNGTLEPSSPTDAPAVRYLHGGLFADDRHDAALDGLAMAHKYPDMRSHDSKALTYTTPTLETERQDRRASGRSPLAEHGCA